MKREIDEIDLENIKEADRSYENADPIANVQEIIPDTDVQLQALILEPAAKNHFIELNRDLKLGNLNENELEEVRESLRTAEYSRIIGLDRSADSYIRDAYIMLNTSGSRKGFQQQMQRSNYIKREETIDNRAQNVFKKMFGSKKEGGF